MNCPLRNRCQASLRILLLVVLGCSTAPAWSQDPAPDKAASRTARQEEMAALIRDIRLIDPAHPDQGPVPLRPEPLQRWTDPTRELSDGALWAFGKSGRPVALATMEIYASDPKTRPLWACELITLAPGPLTAEAGWSLYIPPDRADSGRVQPLKWTPKPPGITLEPVPKAPVPAPTEAERLRQLRTLAGRFSAAQAAHGPGSRDELRLLPRPACRYADSTIGLVDGAIFPLVYGTNPELLLVIEAQKPTDPAQPTAWLFGCVRLSTAELTVNLDGREVWTRPFAQEPNPADAYYFIRTARPLPR